MINVNFYIRRTTFLYLFEEVQLDTFRRGFEEAVQCFADLTPLLDALIITTQNQFQKRGRKSIQEVLDNNRLNINDRKLRNNY